LLGIWALAIGSSCDRTEKPIADGRPRAGGVLVVYCSVDENAAAPILRRFEQQSGKRLQVLYDTEAGKTTTLVNRIVGEAQSRRPRSDVFWSGELFNTIALARQGLLAPYRSTAAADIPERFKDPQHRWTAIALRGRVLAFDPARFSAESVPRTWEELAEPRFAEHLALANPLFGTTKGHIAAAFAVWGKDRGRAFLTKLRHGGVMMVDGNSAAVRAVATGQAMLAATDTDDVWAARRAGVTLDLRFPDLGDGGTLLIPSSVAMVHGGPNGAQAHALVDYLVSEEVELLLALGELQTIPVRESLRRELQLELPPQSNVDYNAVAESMDEAVAAAREILLR